ncbi:MAG: hypothetical protein GXO65_06895 [Euryarchaeota archaeon]|nr:hypothetical protein [Euryarchaeota archaeon]
MVKCRIIATEVNEPVISETIYKTGAQFYIFNAKIGEWGKELDVEIIGTDEQVEEALNNLSRHGARVTKLGKSHKGQGPLRGLRCLCHHLPLEGHHHRGGLDRIPGQQQMPPGVLHLRPLLPGKGPGRRGGRTVGVRVYTLSIINHPHHHGSKYAKMYFLFPRMEENWATFEEIWNMGQNQEKVI